MATGTLQDLLNSGMSRDEINALLSQSNVSTPGFNASTFNSDGSNPQSVQPQQMPQNWVQRGNDAPIDLGPSQGVGPQQGPALDFFYAYITDPTQQTTYWEVYLPGDQLGFDLPDWPADAPRGPFPSGSALLIIVSVDAFTFDYDNFEFNDFNYGNWKSYSLNGWGILNP